MILSISGEPLTGIPGDWTLTWYEDVIYADIAQRDGEAYGSNFRVGDPLLLSIGLAFATSAACVIGALIVGPVLPRVKRRGRIVQEGPPTDLFDRPATRFVADFMGVENLLEGIIEDVRKGGASVRIGSHLIRGEWSGPGRAEAGTRACVAVRAPRPRATDQACAAASASISISQRSSARPATISSVDAAWWPLRWRSLISR